MSTQDSPLLSKVYDLLESGKIKLLRASSMDPVELLVRVYRAQPPKEIKDYYRCVPGGEVSGLPLIGVHFAQPGTSIIEGFDTFEPMVMGGYWPLAGDGFGNFYVGFLFHGKVVVGVVEVLKDAIRPERIVASSIPCFLDGLASHMDEGSEWPWGRAVKDLDPDQGELDKLFQAQKHA